MTEYIYEGKLIKANNEEKIYHIPENVSIIASHAFNRDNVYLNEEIYVPETVKDIESNAFFGCKAFKIVLPNTFFKIPNFAFRHTEQLKEINLPKDTLSIEDGAFAFSGIEEITLPDKLTSIGVEAFAYSKLKEIIFPQSLFTIGRDAFHSCSNLKKIVFSDNIKTIPQNCFLNCYNLDLSSIVFPKNLEVIGPDAFNGFFSPQPATIIIPPSVKTIGKNAFPEGSTICLSQTQLLENDHLNSDEYKIKVTIQDKIDDLTASMSLKELNKFILDEER